MRKISFCLLILFLITLNIKAQIIHKSKVIGVIAMGSYDIAAIHDEISNEVFKSSAYTSGLLIENEIIDIDLGNDIYSNTAKIIKNGCSETILCFRKNSKNDKGKIISSIHKNMKLLQANMDIIARSMVGLINDTSVVNLISEEINQTSIYDITFQRLFEISEKNNANLLNKMSESLIKSGGNLNDVERLKEVVYSFNIDNGIVFEPTLKFPTKNITTQFDIGNSTWDLKTPCIVSISLFNMNGNSFPFYYIKNDTLIKADGDKDSIFVTPSWYISLNPNFSTKSGDENGIVQINQDYEVIGKRKELVNLFRQAGGCICQDFNVGSEEGPVVTLCEGATSEPADCGGGLGCAGKCQLALNKPLIRDCNIEELIAK